MMGEALAKEIAQSPESGLPQWADRTMRVDPYALPLRYTVEDPGGTSYSVARHGAVVKTRLRSGLSVSMALPCRAFEGVAARAVVTPMGAYRVTLELHHRDPALCVPLLVSEDLDDIAADWHSWSRLMKLPMLIVDAEQNANSVKAMLGEIMVEPACDRRKRRDMFRRRPRFLRRRKSGQVGEVVRVSGEEIIARR